jgi:hypothetical protein
VSESTRSASYKPCDCGEDCNAGTEEQPCWGKVYAVDRVETEDDMYWVHACQGHDDLLAGFTVYYNPEPKP